MFWAHIEQTLKIVSGKLDETYFDNPYHKEVRDILSFSVHKQFIRVYPDFLEEPIRDIKHCFCQTPQNEVSGCWDNDFHIYANHGFFVYINMMFASKFPSFPYDFDTDGQNKLSDEEENFYKKLLIFDIVFNPSSYISYIIYGYIYANDFLTKAQGMYMKGIRSLGVRKESNEFEMTLSSFANALYLAICQLAFDKQVDLKNISEETGFVLLHNHWIQRHKQLGRWKDSTVLGDITDILNVMFRVVHMNLISRSESEMEFNIIKSKLRNLFYITGLSFTICKLALQNQNDDSPII